MKESSNALIFKSKIEAGEMLINLLPINEISNENWNILALGTNSLEIAKTIANKAKINVDCLFTKHIYAPNNEKCPIAIVSETNELVVNEKLINSFNLQYDYIYGEANRKYEEEILPKIYKFRKGEKLKSLKDKNILIVDEGCQTGLVLSVAIKSLINLKAKKISVAIPIIPKDVSEELSKIVDEIYTICEIDDYITTDFYYNIK